MKSKLLLLSFYVLLGAGCLDKIEFDRPATIDNGIAIQGKLVKGSPSTVRVSIRKVFNFKEAKKLLKVQSVELINELGEQLILDSRKDGLHEQVLTDFPIEYGMGYKIRVSTFDNRIFESTFDYIVPAPSPTKLVGQLEKRERLVIETGSRKEFEVIAFRIDTPIKNKEDASNSRILWEMGITYKVPDALTAMPCYVSTSPFQNYIPFDGTASTAESIKDVFLYETVPTSLFARGYYLSVFQQSLSETAFDYWSQVNLIVNRSGSLFESPVGNISSNISNINNPEEEIFGFFYATEEKVIRTYIDPAVAGYPLLPCRPCDCSFLGGSPDKPDWWQE